MVMAPMAGSIAWASVQQEEAEPGKSPQPDATAGAKISDLGVRKLPILSPEIEARLGASPLLSEVQTLIEQTASAIGIPGEAVREAVKADRRSAEPSTTQGLLDGMSAEAIAQHAVEIIDLAGLLIIEESDASSDWSMDASMSGDSQKSSAELLRVVADATGSCEATLAYGHSLSLIRPSSQLTSDRDEREQAMSLHADRVAEVLQHAHTTCGEDPTALWALGVFEVAKVVDSQCSHRALSLDEYSLTDAETVFQQLQEAFPDSPAGLVGSAEVKIAQAGSNDFYAERPFTAKSAWEEASDLLGQAAQLTSSEVVAMRRAVALCGIGKCEEAADLLPQDLLASNAGQGILGDAADILLGAGRYEAALSLPSVRDVSNSPTREVIPTGESHYNLQGTAWGMAANPARGSSRCGSPWGQDHGFLSLYRRGWMAGTHLHYAQREAQILAADEAELVDMTRTSEGGDAVPILLAYEQWERAELVSQAWLEGATDEVALHAARSGLGVALIGQERYSEAIAVLSEATSPSDLNETAKSHLRLGYALKKSGDLVGAEREYVTAVEYARYQPGTMESDPSADSYWGCLGLGEIYMEQNRDAESLQILLLAQEVAGGAKFGSQPDTGVAANNAAIVAMRMGDFDIGLEQAEKALAFDPKSPIFLQTYADAQRRGAPPAPSSPVGTPGGSESGPNTDDEQGCGAMEGLIQAYEAAVAADASSPVAWNNLGVVQAACNMQQEAVDSFKNSIRANPEYSRAWFNYGSYLLVDGGWNDFLAAEGALGIAGGLDKSLREQGPSVLPDDEIYDSGLDLSKALPPDWRLGDYERQSPGGFTAVLLFLALFRIVADLSKHRLVDKLTRIAMTGRAGRALSLSVPGAVGVAGSATVLVLLSQSEAKERLAFVPIAIAAVILPTAIRSLGVTRTRERTPLPMFLASVVAAPFGAVLPPLPAASENGSWQRSVAPAVVGLLVIAAVVVAVTGGVPLERATLAALAAVLATTLLPLPPYDGSRFDGVSSGIATLGLAVLTVLFAVPLV